MSLSSLVRRIWQTEEDRRRDELARCGDRRLSPRYPSFDNHQAFLGWWHEGVFHELQGEVIDVSTGGCAIVVPGSPPHPDVWIRLGEPMATGWVEAVVARDLVKAKGRHEIGLAFVDACPFELFKAVRGIDGKPPPNHYSVEFLERLWR